MQGLVDEDGGKSVGEYELKGRKSKKSIKEDRKRKQPIVMKNLAVMGQGMG